MGGADYVELPKMPNLLAIEFQDDYCWEDKLPLAGQEYVHSDGYFDAADGQYYFESPLELAICRSAPQLVVMCLYGYANAPLRAMLKAGAQRVAHLEVYNWDDSFAEFLPQLEYLKYRVSHGRRDGPRPSLSSNVKVEQETR